MTPAEVKAWAEGAVAGVSGDRAALPISFYSELLNRVLGMGVALDLRDITFPRPMPLPYPGSLLPPAVPYSPNLFPHTVSSGAGPIPKETAEFIGVTG